MMRAVTAAKNNEMRWLGASKLCEVQESKSKDEVKIKEQNFGKSVNIPSFRRPVLGVSDFKQFPSEQATWAKLWTSYT